MMTILFLLCLSLLDFRQTPIPDSFDKRFVVTELVEQSTTGCASSPQSGRPQNQTLSIDWITPNEADTMATVLPISPSIDPVTLSESTFTPKVMPYNPPGLPDPPEPEMPPVAVVSEPPTAAILGISGVALIYLIFGRNRQKLYRRPR